MKRDTTIFQIAIFIVLFLTGLTIWHNYNLKTSLISKAPTVDIGVINNQVNTGNLTINEAKFYRAIVEQ